MSITPSTLRTPVTKLTRAQIYNEFRYLHGLAGGKKNVSNLTKLYVFDPTIQNMAVALDAPTRYAELEQEVHDRRVRQAKYLMYVNGGAHARAKLETIFHGHPEQS